MRIPTVALLATLILSSTPATASAATEAEIAVTRTTVNIVLPVISIALVAVIILIVKASKIESKAGEMPWWTVAAMLFIFVLGTLSSSLIPTGQWVSGWIVKSYHPEAKDAGTTVKKGDPVGTPADYVTLKGNSLERNDKALPEGWEIGVTQQNGVAGIKVTRGTPRIMDLSQPVILFFDPDQTIHKGREALGTMKLK